MPIRPRSKPIKKQSKRVSPNLAIPKPAGKPKKASKQREAAVSNDKSEVGSIKVQVAKLMKQLKELQVT